MSESSMHFKNVPNHYPEQKIWLGCLVLWVQNLWSQPILWLLMSAYQLRNFRPKMKNKEIHLRYLEEYMSYSSAMYGASMYLYDGKCSFKSCFELASKASFCTSCCCCSKCSSQGRITKFSEVLLRVTEKSSLQNCAIKEPSVGWEKNYLSWLYGLLHIFLGMKLFCLSR